MGFHAFYREILSFHLGDSVLHDFKWPRFYRSVGELCPAPDLTVRHAESSVGRGKALTNTFQEGAVRRK